MKRFYTLLHFGLFLSFLLVGFKTNAQTVLVDSFTRADNTTVGGGWTEIETGAPNGARIVSNRLVLGSTTAGVDFVYKDLSGLTGPITTDGITNNSNVLTWAFNFRQTRTDPSGFDAGNYGVGFVLAKTTTPVSTGNGYAVIIGQSGTTDAIRLVRFTGGTNANADFTNIISGGDFGAEYISVRVTYDPATDNWSLYAESNASAFPRADPRNTTTQIGSTTSNTTYTATGNDLKYFGGFWNHSTGASDNGYFDDIFAPVVPTSSYSGVAIGANSEPAVLPSTTTAMSGAISPQTNAIMNFDFEVTDDANTTSGNDALPTLITQIVIPQGTGNDIADWTQAIQAAEISDGTNTLAGTVNTNNLTFPSIPTGSGALGEVTDGSNKTYTLKITLKTALGGSLPTTIDGLNLAFKIDRTNFTTASSATSTQFESGAGTVVESGSTNNAVAVVATKLNFVQQPTNVNQNATMSPSVTISANDPNNNRDLGYTTNVSLSSTGTMTGDPIVVAASSGLASYGGIVHTVAGTGFVLSGTSGSLTATGNSSAFNVNALNPEINLQGNATNILDGDPSPSVTDHTDFGSVAWGGSFTRTFTIQNTGSGALSISGASPYVVVTGTHNSEFVVTTPPSNSIAAGGSTTFIVTFTPAGTGTRSATLTINSNDADESVYDFAIQGTGAPSNLSDVADNTNYATGSPEFNSNINYINFTDGTSTITGKMIPMKIKIRDGGSTLSDADNLSTILTSIKFTVKDHLGANQIVQIKTAILTTTGGTVIATASKVGAELVFSGLSGANVTAADGTEQILHLRVSFDEAQVIDNTKLVFAVSQVVSGGGNSNFATLDGGGASSDASNANDRNRIEVTATKLAFLQQPSTTNISLTMSPAPTVRALDANNRLDLDYVTSISITSTGTMTGSPIAVTPVAGVATFSSVVHTAIGTGYNLTASSGAFPNVNSTNFDITNVPYVTGDYRTNPLFTGSIFFNSTNFVSGIAPWQSWNGSAWVDVTHSTGSPNSPQNLATKPGTIYVGGGAGVTYVDAAGGANYNNIIVEFASSSGVFGSYDNTTGIGILTGKRIEIKKGIFDLGGRFDLQGTGQLIIRDGAEMDIASSSSAFLRNASSTWEVENNAFVFINSYIANAWTGTEIFHEESYFEVTDWDETADANLFATGTISTYTFSGFSALFGNLSLNFSTLSSNWDDVFPDGTYNLTHGDFDVTNNDASGGDNINLVFSGNVNVTVGGDMNIYGAEDVQFQVGAGTSYLNVKGSFNKIGTGAWALHPYTAGKATLSIDSNLNVNDGIFYVTNTSAGAAAAVINLKGNLTLVSGAYLTNSNASGYTNDSINFTGSGTIQTVDVVPHTSNDLMRLRFFVKTNAYVQFKDQDVALGTNSGFTVEADATLDFGFNGTTALNLVTAGANTGTYFSSLQKSILKITNTSGISTTGAIGNVQVVASNRLYNQTATFWYIGKADQVTGNGITTGSTPKVIICDLITQTTKLSFTNSTAISGTTTVDAVYGGHLYIKKGRVEESSSAYITSGGGTLRMEPGTYYYIPKGNNSLALSDADPIPRLSSAIHPTGQYYLSGGTIELAGTGVNGFQSLRGNNLDYKIYKNVTYSGANVSGVDYKNLTSNVVIDSALTIIGDAIVECHGLAITTPQTFTGAGGLVMSGTNSRIRFLKLSTPQPELTGVNVDYALTGGYVEFYGSSSTQQQQIRGTYDSPTKVINYFNIDVNAAGGNYESGLGAGGNLDLISSITLQGTMNVNSPAVLRLDETDFIYKYVGNTTNTVNINSGAGLLYGSPFGITTAATGGTGLDPTVGAANPSAGNIRTSIRNFNSGASYGFIGNGNMPSGDGIPSSVAGLYVYKTASADVVTLSKSVLDNGVLALHNGKILSSSTNKLTLETTASIVNTPTNAGGIANMGHENSYVIGVMGRNTNASGSEKVFPIGSATLYGPLAISPASATAQTYSCEYFSTGFGDYDIDAADVPMLDHVSVVEYWTVASTASGANDNANVKLFWRDHTIVSGTSGDWADLRVAHHDGTDWNDEGNNATSGVSTSWGYVQSNVIPNFSPITFGSLIPDNPLPVELITFVASCDNGIVNIHWATASEVNNDYFVLEKSSDGENFTQLAVKDGYNTTSITHHYFETDNNPFDGTTYYRLKQVDNNGEVSYSKIIKSDCFNGNDEFVNIFYAPGEGITATSYMNEDEDFNFKIFNDIGQVLFDFNKDLVVGFTRNLLNNADLATGTYFVTAESNERRISVKLFVP